MSEFPYYGTNSQALLYLIDLELVGTMPALISGNAQILLHENILWKVISLSSCEFLRKLKVFRKPKQSTEFES